jgi:hypothetical protein
MIEDDPKTGPLDVSHTLTDAMERAGVHPAYVHAVRRCGFVYTEENAHSLTAHQVERWNAALEEWFAEHPDDPQGDRPTPHPGLGNGRSGE